MEEKQIFEDVASHAYLCNVDEGNYNNLLSARQQTKFIL
jgi:hypothetical protein